MKKITLLILSFTLILGVFAQRISIKDKKFQVDGKQIWLNGANTPWNKWNDFGTGNYDDTWWNNHFLALSDAGINCIRVWISCNGGGINIESDGTVTGITSSFFSDLDKFFALAEKYKVYIFATMLSFDHAKQGSPNYNAYRNCYKDNDKAASLVDNYVVPFVKRYNDNPYLFGIDACNEIEWNHENADQGSIAWDRLQYLVARMAAGIHANSQVLVSLGSAAIKWNSDKAGAAGNFWKDEALKAQYNDPQAFLDFYSPHWYGWTARWFGNPCTERSPADYGIADKPCFIGECPAKGMFTQDASGKDILISTPADMYEQAFKKGWQGVFPWTSNGVDTNGSMADFKIGTLTFKKNHPELVNPLSMEVIPATNVTIDPAVVSILINKPKQLKVNILPENASNIKVKWSSDNESIATVDSTGLLTGNEQGTCTISIITIDGNITATCIVTVIANVYFSLPGKIEAEEYAGMNGIQTEACSEGTLNVGWIETGDWLSYDVDILESGSYNLKFRVASQTSGGAIEIKSGNISLGKVDFKATDGWQTWSDVSQKVYMNAGKQSIQIIASKGGWNINWWEASKTELFEQTQYAFVPLIKTSIKLDGIEDDVWKSLEPYPITYFIDGVGYPETNDCSGYFKAFFNQDTLYVMIYALDNKLFTKDPTVYFNDGFEIYLDLDNSKSAVYSKDCYQYRFIPGSKELSGRWDLNTWVPPMVDFAINVNEGKDRILEVAFPLKSLGRAASIKNGEKMGFEVEILDNDGSGRNHVLSWNKNDHLAWQNPSKMGTVEFIGDDEVKTTVYTQKLKLAYVFPNPSFRFLSIHSFSIIDEISLFTFQGREIFKQTNQNSKTSTLDLSEFQPGIYFLWIKDILGNQSNSKIIKI